MFKARLNILFTEISTAKGVIQLQNFFVFSIAIWLLILVIKNIVIEKTDRLMSMFYLGFILAYWFLPFSMGLEISLYRGSVMLGVLVLLLKEKSLDFKILLLISYVSLIKNREKKNRILIWKGLILLF